MSESTKDELFFENEARKHQQIVSKLMMKGVRDLITRAMNHDASKLENPERETFVKTTPALKKLTYGSPEYEKQLESMGKALEHHYNNNSHHPEHFVFDRSKEGLSCSDPIASMNLFVILEMLIDWMAATQRHADGDIFKSIKINEKRFGINPQMCEVLKNTVRYLHVIAPCETKQEGTP